MLGLATVGSVATVVAALVAWRELSRRDFAVWGVASAAALSVVSGVGGMVSVSLVSGFLAFAGAILGIGPAVRPRDRLSALLGFWGLTVAAGVLGTLVNDNDSSLTRLASFVLGSLPWLLALLVLRPSPAEVRMIGRGLLVGATASCLWGVGAYVGVVEGISTSGRTSGLTENPTQQAMVAGLGLGCAALIRRAPLRLVAVCVMISGGLATGSRSFGLAILAVLLVISLLSRYRGWAPALILVAGAALQIYQDRVVNLLPARVSDSRALERSNEGRLDFMAAAWGDIVDGFFVLGSGIPNEELAHNVFLLYWSAFGIVGLGFVLYQLFVTIVVPLRSGFIWLAIASAGFWGAVLVNNAIAAPFAWVLISLATALPLHPDAHRPLQGQAKKVHRFRSVLSDSA